MFTILINITKKNYFFIILKKILKRFEKDQSIVATEWAKSQLEVTTEQFLFEIDQDLFEETKSEMQILEKNALKKLSTIKHSLGGGGNYLLLYFLIRKFKPEVIIETGVAAGWTTSAILRAIKKNKFGKLYSSDFPYFRLKNPEQYIGFLVKDDIDRSDWTLDIRGDDVALKSFASKLKNNSVKLFHYDSDKSYEGRSNALKTLKNKFSNEAIIIFDDIQNNLHFKDFVINNKLKFKVFEFKKKYLGLVGV